VANGLAPVPSFKDLKTNPVEVTFAPGSLAAACAKSFCAKTDVWDKAQNATAKNKCFEMFIRHFRLKPEFFKCCDV
jgi:hypothetical protein